MSEVAREPWNGLVLAIDTATAPSSVALLRGGELLAVETGPFGKGADAWVVAAVDRLLHQAAIEPAELGRVAATVGPGTFTGIRVGLATAAGLAAGADLDAVGISTLEALFESAQAARGRRPDQRLVAAIDARRGQIYAAGARAPSHPAPGMPLEWGPELLDPAELGRRLATGCDATIGSGVTLADPPQPELEVDDAEPLAIAVGRLATRLSGPSLPPLLPVYMRPPDAVPGRSPLRRGGRSAQV